MGAGREGEVGGAAAGGAVGAAWWRVGDPDAGDEAEGAVLGGADAGEEGDAEAAGGAADGAGGHDGADERAADAQDEAADGVAFAVVAVEEGFGVGGVAVEGGGEFPGEVGGVLQAGVHAEAAGGEWTWAASPARKTRPER